MSSLAARVAAVVPCKDEAERIAATVAAVAALPQVGRVVVVDDGSTDGTAAAARAAGADVVRHERNRGKAAALETGVRRVRELEQADAVADPTAAWPAALLFVDGDLQETADEPRRAHHRGARRQRRHDDRHPAGPDHRRRWAGPGRRPGPARHRAPHRLPRGAAALGHALPEPGRLRRRAARSPAAGASRPRSPSTCCAPGSPCSRCRASCSTGSAAPTGAARCTGPSSTATSGWRSCGAAGGRGTGADPRPPALRRCGAGAAAPRRPVRPERRPARPRPTRLGGRAPAAPRAGAGGRHRRAVDGLPPRWARGVPRPARPGRGAARLARPGRHRPARPADLAVRVGRPRQLPRLRAHPGRRRQPVGRRTDQLGRRPGPGDQPGRGAVDHRAQRLRPVRHAAARAVGPGRG